ncbi:phage integrase N-terminal domain-containing protein [Sinorhizobium fredii]|uniref:Putative integrase n=1 Tax=Sinorhizobium fredii (strain HH103) TaxID=1117943 RepID=A0A0A8WH96_SINF1|nr:phage integrase N-terminal domain-containing protein [Sinorhizobium fredii]CEL26563.1 putative integrase [Sinorhizobium fredii HH103]
MKSLNFDLLNITRHCGEGSFSTQATRARGLQQLADELHDLGYKLKAAKNLAPKHVDALVTSWKANGIADATIRNRLGWVRWWSEKVNKSGMVPADNVTYGLAMRQRYNGNKAQELTPEILDRVKDPRIQMALKLERLFGLRREEALKMRPVIADRGDRLILQASWTKGGRYREIPIWHPRQRSLLAEARAMCGDGSLIGDGRNYKQAQKHYDNTLLKAGVRNAHGFRHKFAQWRYKTLTGWECPAAGGPTIDKMTPQQERGDHSARFQISQELGHDRLDVTDTYLGRARPVKESRGA